MGNGKSREIGVNEPDSIYIANIPEIPEIPDIPEIIHSKGIGQIRNKFERLYNLNKSEYKKIINFNDVEKGNIYIHLIHYDKNLKKNENFEYYRYFSIKLIGNYSPFDDLKMLKLYISKTNELTQPPHYILMISGMESDEILKEFHEFGFIDDIIIFCLEPNKYLYLKEIYSKVQLITNNFYNVIDFLKSKRHSDYDLNMDNHLLLTPLITYYEYKKGLFPIHRVLSYFFFKYGLFSNNSKNDYFRIAKEFIKKSTYESKIKDKIIKIMEELRDCDPQVFPKKCIKYYTGEDLCYVFNKALRNFGKKLC